MLIWSLRVRAAHIIFSLMRCPNGALNTLCFSIFNLKWQRRRWRCWFMGRTPRAWDVYSCLWCLRCDDNSNGSVNWRWDQVFTCKLRIFARFRRRSSISPIDSIVCSHCCGLEQSNCQHILFQLDAVVTCNPLMHVATVNELHFILECSEMMTVSVARA